METLNWRRSPVYLGLPAKFRGWRPGQLQAIQQVVEGRGLTPLNLPTGSGKSLIYMAAAKLTKGRAIFLTSTKALQQQLIHDFAKVGLVSIQGKKNYACPKTNWLVGDEALCSILPCDSMFLCPYYLALKTAKRATLVTTNYAYFLTDADLGDFDTIVCDEAHLLPHVLESHYSTTINFPYIKQTLKLEADPPEKPEAWTKWAYQSYGLLSQQITAAKEERDEARLKELLPVRRSLEKLPVICRDRFVWAREENDRFSFRAVLPSARILVLLAKRLVLTSATLTDKVLEQCDLEGKVTYYDSQFSPALQPVYALDTVKVNFTMAPFQQIKLLRAIDRIVGERLDRKGIIHVSSYRWAEVITQNSRHQQIFWTHSSKDINQVIAAFRRAPAPAVMVSPSLNTGFDFPYDDCTYQIISKIPFPDLTDKVTQAKKDLDAEYLAHQAIQTLVQCCGRGYRAADDYCETLILDANFGWLLQKYRHLFPRWFLRCLCFQPEPPAPLPQQYFPFGDNH